MASVARREREDAFRAEIARVVQVLRHHLPAGQAPQPAAALAGPARHLAALLDARASTEHLRQAALAVVGRYEWPRPDVSGADEGPIVDSAVLAAVERLRVAIDALDQ